MVLLVRFGELALKSRFVRRQLRNRLVSNIQDLFAADGTECIIESDEARVYVHTNETERARGILTRVFGIVSVSPATETHADLESLRRLVVSEASRVLQPGKTFAIRPRRTGTHPFSSQDLARDLGRAVLESMPDVRVDLTNPDVVLQAEVRRNRGFVFHETWAGPGGLPLGSQGRALAFVTDDLGMVAAWMGMKRGCKVTVAAPREGPYVEPLRRWDVHLKVLEARDPTAMGELVRISRAEALFLGTAEIMDAETRPTLGVPVFEPVIGLATEEIARLAERIRQA